MLRDERQSRIPDLWDLVWGKPSVDPDALAGAVEREAGKLRLDYRTRLLIRDSIHALETYWAQLGQANGWPLVQLALPLR